MIKLFPKSRSQADDASSQLDYLQMDIHPAEATLEALKALPMDKYRFSVITYEHNGYDNICKNINHKKLFGEV